MTTTLQAEPVQPTKAERGATPARWDNIDAAFPFVFGVPADTQARVFSHEVQEVLWVPLTTLLAPETGGSVEIALGEGQTQDFPCWRVGDRVIWGLTYRILNRFSQEYLVRNPQPIQQ